MPPPWSRDAEHLRLLAIFHYIVGGIIALFSSCAIIHFIMGLTMITHPGAFMPPAGSPAPPPPKFIGYIFTFFAGGVVLSGWVLGGLTIYSGRCMSRRTSRIFSMVVAGICCIWFPFGTVLGVFTFIVLARPSVKEMYENPGAY